MGGRGDGDGEEVEDAEGLNPQLRYVTIDRRVAYLSLLPAAACWCFVIGVADRDLDFLVGLPLSAFESSIGVASASLRQSSKREISTLEKEGRAKVIEPADL